MAFSADGTVIASGSTVRLWDAQTGSCKCMLTGEMWWRSFTFCVSFSPNSNILAAGGFGGNIRLYDPATGELKSTLSGPSDTVTFVAWNNDGTKLCRRQLGYAKNTPDLVSGLGWHFRMLR